MDKILVRFKVEKFKRDLKEKTNNVLEWCGQHKEEIVIFVPVVTSGVFKIVKMHSRKTALEDERYLKERYVYDRSAGHYYETRRKIKSSEWAIIDDRRKNGESLGEILQSMRLLK